MVGRNGGYLLDVGRVRRDGRGQTDVRGMIWRKPFRRRLAYAENVAEDRRRRIDERQE
ncbi:hypothetical protein C8J28_11017 [Cereibacter azotoformans]|uniref:Uncharacterized protein n=1 Tax=Cereibacter azotoformans TaxID=43057 RepID=A0A2T5K656_9RHOB|nr:hypothetical protein C8J28_11017 [Cereibacter azotoformans]